MTRITKLCLCFRQRSLARIQIALGAMFFVWGCGPSDDLITREEAINIADDASDSSALVAEVDRLDRRIAELEDQIESNRRSIEFLLTEREADLAREEIYNLRIGELEDRLGM